MSLMKSAITTLFSEEPPRRTAPSAIVVSLIAHVVGFFLLFLGLKHAPRTNDQSAFDRYTVRLLKPIQIEDPKPRQMAKVEGPRVSASHGSSSTSSSNPSSSSQQAGSAAANTEPDLKTVGGAASAPASAQPQLAQLPVRTQTLIQPDAPKNVQLLDEVPVPVAVIWTPVDVPVKTIIAPPQEITVANLRPAIIKPNRESKLADVNISSARLPSAVPIVAGSTSPVVVKGPETAPRQIPTSASAKAEEPAPARLISLSQLAAMGQTAVPLANMSAQGGTSVVLAPPRADNSTGSGAGGAAKQGVGGSGTGQGTGAGAGAVARVGVGGGGAGGQGGGNGVSGLAGGGSGSGGGDHAGAAGEAVLGGGYEGSVTRLALPRDGRFGVVVVGSSVAEEYPEVVEIWHDRLVYTVYLHVGTGKNWILQYSVPAEVAAANGGLVTKPEAPWPYDIVRPHLADSDWTADAIMVHGFVNLAGRFERLRLVFPQGFAQAKFLMDSLMQWKFRPAKQGTSLAMVEVLLIIPSEQ